MKNVRKVSSFKKEKRSAEYTAVNKTAVSFTLIGLKSDGNNKKTDVTALGVISGIKGMHRLSKENTAK